MPGLIRGVARTAVVAGTATAVSGRVARRQQGKWAAQEGQEEPPPPPEPAASEPPAEDPMITKLKDLAALRDQGILTEEEFAAQKARVLGG